MTTTPTLRDAAQAVTIITTPSGDHRWIAKDAAEVAHFSQPGQGHKIEVYTLAAPADALAEPVATDDPMDWPLPCDVTVGHGTMRKGVSLRTLVMRMKVLYEMATGNNADEVASRSPEQNADLAAAIRAKGTHD